MTHSGHVGTCASGAGGPRRVRHQPPFAAQRVDVGGDLHRPAAQLTLRRSMTKTRVSFAAIPAPGD